jgi:hypothetical protein
MQEVTKDEFREAYFRHGRGLDGWTQEYWIEHFETAPDRGMRFCMELPQRPEQTRMMLVADYGAREHRLFFMTEDAVEDLFSRR